MGKSTSPNKVAYMEDADEDDNILEDKKTYARSTAAASPSKEKPNTKKSRRESRPPSPLSSTDSSDSTTHPSASKPAPKMKSKEERRKSVDRPVITKGKQRPPARTSHGSKTAPSAVPRADDPSYYGVAPEQTVAKSRPRAHTRPQSYCSPSSSRPPLSMSAHYPGPHQNPFPPPYPPQPWSAGPGPMPMLPHQSPMLPPPHAEPIQRDLSMRFSRPQSSMGFRQASNSHEYEAVPERTVARRHSTSKKPNKERDDRFKMPPPPRPKSTRPPERVVLRPAPPPRQPSATRKSVNFEELSSDDDESLYETSSHRASLDYSYGHSPMTISRRRQSFVEESSAEDSDYELPPRPRSRRNSTMALEDNLRNAAYYQNEVNTAPESQLTVDALKHVKTGGSRSTRSSASRDESDYKHSATTRTTRSGSGDDDITIKVPMGAIVQVGNTKIHCKDGGDISVGRNGSSRGGSEQATSYGDDRRSRSDRSLATRTRSSSQAASYSRGLPPSRHLPGITYPNYGYPPPYPNYYDHAGPGGFI
ncbi:hypothetical protein F4780DRAFT_778132 [Xylariomycetidae sp. FL0641]|nr:hypothetical protein F4780DRAFT_778132 [Xylariomycetidae sp. FL0641]